MESSYAVTTGVVWFSRRAGVITFVGQREFRLGYLRLRNFEHTEEVVVDVRGVRMLRVRDAGPEDLVGTWFEGEDRLLEAVPAGWKGQPLDPETTLTIMWHAGPIQANLEPCDRCDGLRHKGGRCDVDRDVSVLPDRGDPRPLRSAGKLDNTGDSGKARPARKVSKHSPPT